MADSVVMKLITEARFLAGEDARGCLVVLEPETELTDVHLAALRDCGAAGFVSDFTSERFEKPDDIPELSYDRARFAQLKAFAVTPRIGVRLRTHAASDLDCRVAVGKDGSLELVPVAVPAKRDRSNDPEIDGAAIRAALAELGVRKGDSLMVHSSLSACGHIVGGAKTVIEALVESVGDDGRMCPERRGQPEMGSPSEQRVRAGERGDRVGRPHSDRVHEALSRRTARRPHLALLDRLGKTRRRSPRLPDVGRAAVLRQLRSLQGDGDGRQDPPFRQSHLQNFIHPLP